MKVTALRFIQNGQVIYMTSINSEDLIKLGKVDEWDHTISEYELDVNELLERQGYQRRPIRSHYTKVGKYLKEYKEEALLPTAVFLNSRNKLDFRPFSEGSYNNYGDDNIGILELPEDGSIYIVDGQHRIFGLSYAIEELELEEIRKFPIPVIITDQLNKIEEIRHFHIVNSTQKKVRTDLAERLLRILAEKDERVYDSLQARGKDWKLRAIRITDVLVDDINSPWYKRIKKPNQPSSSETIATQVSFTSSLRPVLTSEFALNESDEVVINWINSYWKALKELMPEAFDDPRNYVVQKTPGMYSLHSVMPYILYECAKFRDFSKERMKDILRRDNEHFDSEFWRSGGEGAALYNSAKAFKILADEIRKGLKGE